MKYLLLFSFSLIIISCNSSHKKTPAIPIQEPKDSVGELTASIQEKFDDFIIRFHTDIIFQAKRIANGVTGYNYEENLLDEDDNDSTERYVCANYSWNKDDLHGYMLFLNEARKDTTYSVSYDIKSEYSAMEKIFIPQSDCYCTLWFDKKDGKWYLTTFDASEM